MATFKRYLMFQAMMFVFGIVGPIFLIMFFATQPDPTVKWAYWWGLFITAGDVLIALWLTDASGATTRRRRTRASGWRSRNACRERTTTSGGCLRLAHRERKIRA